MWGGIFGHPRDIQLGNETRETIKSKVIGRFYCPLPLALREVIEAKIAVEFPGRENLTTEEKFELVYARVRRSADAAHRLENTRNQYAFARNLALTLMIVGGLFLVAAGLGRHGQVMFVGRSDMWWLAGGSFAAALGMALRFLKFYSIFYAQAFRAYTAEPLQCLVVKPANSDVPGMAA